MSDWESDMARQRENLSADRNRKQDADADPGLDLWNRDFLLLLAAALLVAAVVLLVAYRLIGASVEVNDRALTPAQHLTAAFASATAIGAVFALMVNLRKQNLTEQLAKREITVAFTERFRSAAQQLGGASPAERLAGVYAMAALADEYPTRRQQCVDVLCGYLRLPFDPATDHLADQSTTTTQAFQDGRTHTTHQNPASRPFDRQVRETIITVIRDHTQRDVPISWSALDFNLNGAHLTNVDLSEVVFSGQVTFDGVTFSGQNTLFGRATFSDSSIIRFAGATFSGPYTSFNGATFSGEGLSFDGATFSGPYIWFAGATFSGLLTSFKGATFSGELTSFDGATFSGELIWFNGATFSGEETSFDEATFSGPHIWFNEATFSGETTFDNVVIGDDARVLGLEDPRLIDGAQITRDGEPLRGWPPVNKSVEKSGE